MQNFIKRFFDIFCSLLALIVLSPLFLIVIIGIKLSSKGPIFYKANRVAKDGKPFSMYKFRSMHVVEGNGEGNFIAEADRIFPLGAFMRKSKIDELPQLINLLKGDMSIVGPRPFNASSIDTLLTGKYRDVLNVRPGLTSYASLFDYKHGELFISDNGQYIRDVLPVKLELELYYAQNWSIWKDIKLIGETIICIIQVVLGKTEYKYTKLEEKAKNKVLN